MADDVCNHLDTMRDVVQQSEGCMECLKMNDTWVHLRLCRTCGHVGCCDSSKNKHARKHFNADNKHPIMSSLEDGEDWTYCFIDKLTWI